MEIREKSLSFPVVRGTCPLTASGTWVFPRPVDQAVAAERGYQFGSATHFGLLAVALDTSVNRHAVTAQSSVGCRGWGGSWDDPYEGQIHFAVVGE